MQQGGATPADPEPPADISVAGLRLPAAKSDWEDKEGSQFWKCVHTLNGAGQAVCAKYPRRKRVASHARRQGLSLAGPRAKEAPLFPAGVGGNPLDEATATARESLGSPGSSPTGHSARRPVTKRLVKLGWNEDEIPIPGRGDGRAAEDHLVEAATVAPCGSGPGAVA